MRTLKFVFIISVLVLIAGSTVLAANGGYYISHGLTASGGGIRSSQGYLTQDIIGQSAAGGSNSEHYTLYAGFYNPFQPPPMSPEEVAVGGEVYPITRTALLAPWLVVAVAIVAGGIILVRRRVHS